METQESENLERPAFTLEEEGDITETFSWDNFQVIKLPKEYLRVILPESVAPKILTFRKDVIQYVLQKRETLAMRGDQLMYDILLHQLRPIIRKALFLLHDREPENTKNKVYDKMYDLLEPRNSQFVVRTADREIVFKTHLISEE